MSNKNDSALFICITAIICSLILAGGLRQVGKSDKTVSVRGLSEREVSADLAVWKLSFSTGQNDLTELKQDIIDKTQIVKDFLTSQGLDSTDYTILAPEITDITVNMYMDSSRSTYKYVAKQSFLIRTNKVNIVKQAANSTLDLIGKGISVSNDYDSKVEYEFTSLNDIKPEMIAEATQNARLAAQQFARDSNCKVGTIKSATQGLFSIEDAAAGLEDIKKIRVITTVIYTIK